MQPKFTMEQLSNLFKTSVIIFFSKETNNIMSGVSEQSLCGRLALYLEMNFKNYEIIGNYYADTEYNRKQNGKIKTILDGNERVIQISSDLLVHSRGEACPDNLITIEMKKSSRPLAHKIKDKIRLQAMTKKTDVWSWDGTDREHVSGYILGIYMEIDQAKRTCKFEKYKGGNVIEKWIQPF